MWSSHTGFITQRFFPPENRNIIDSGVLVLEPGKSIPARKNIKNGQEVLCVLKGKVELVHSDQTVTLFEGDSIHYYSTPEKEMITNKNERSLRSSVGWDDIKPFEYLRMIFHVN